MRRPSRARPRDEMASSEGTRLFLIVVGVTLLIGLVTGGVWIAWNLVTIHVLGWR